MGFNDLLNEIGDWINEGANGFDKGVDITRRMFSGEMQVNQAKNEYISCKKKCRLVMLLLFFVCGLIIYFHLRG